MASLLCKHAMTFQIGCISNQKHPYLLSRKDGKQGKKRRCVHLGDIQHLGKTLEIKKQTIQLRKTV